MHAQIEEHHVHFLLEYQQSTLWNNVLVLAYFEKYASRFSLSDSVVDVGNGCDGPG